jgi:serine/threonine protein kinase
LLFLRQKKLTLDDNKKNPFPQYAVKVVSRAHWARHPERLDSILREIAIMTQCDHPNILSVYEWFQTPESLHIVTELARGGDLLDRLEESGPLAAPAAGKIMRQVLSALKYLHERGVVHRDLKPENILLVDRSGSDVVRLCDFGTAACVADPPQRGGNILATYEYVAPEVLRKGERMWVAVFFVFFFSLVYDFTLLWFSVTLLWFSVICKCTHSRTYKKKKKKKKKNQATRFVPLRHVVRGRDPVHLRHGALPV